MATSKPRVTVTLEPHVYSTLKELAALQGRSLSSLISEQLELLHPVEQKVLDAMRNVFAIEEEAKRDVLDQLSSAQAQAEESFGSILSLLDGFAAASQPPYGNTGVTTRNPPTARSSKNASNPHGAKDTAEGGQDLEEGGQ